MLIVQITEHFVHVMKLIFRYNSIIVMRFHRSLSGRNKWSEVYWTGKEFKPGISLLILDVLFHHHVVVEYFHPKE
jgi:hypothetical protein